jgi:hypothetical protein
LLMKFSPKTQLKAMVVEACGSQTLAARRLRIHESRLSRILNGWQPASERERRAIVELLGQAAVLLADRVYQEAGRVAEV